VDDAVPVKRPQGLSELGGDRHDVRGPETPAAQGVVQRRTLEQLHHHEGAAVLDPDVEDGHHSGMRDARRKPGLAHHTGRSQLVEPLGSGLGGQLHGDAAVERQVVCLPDGAHAARAQLPPQPVPPCELEAGTDRPIDRWINGSGVAGRRHGLAISIRIECAFAAPLK
jgi:hypothetical protein